MGVPLGPAIVILMFNHLKTIAVLYMVFATNISVSVANRKLGE